MLQKVIKADKCPEGVLVTWRKKGKKTTTQFTFAQLIEMQANALDILQHPKNWGVDDATEKIVSLV